MGKPDSWSVRAAIRRKPFLVRLATVGCAAVLAFQVEVRPATAAPPVSRTRSLEATTSDAARLDAIKAIPMSRLAPEDRAKVQEVVANAALFRRMPIEVVDCDPDLYLFLVRHPDVVVNIWEVMKASRMQLRQIDADRFRINEPAGAAADFEFVYRGHDTHVLYGEGSYAGPLMPQPIKGRSVLLLKCGYVRETNGRYYITSRLDCFLTIEPAGVELLTKTVSPLLGKTVDNNFLQTVAFVGSLSRTAELNPPGVQRLAMRLTHVQPEVRQQFAQIAGKIGPESAAHDETPLAIQLAVRPEDAVER